MPLTIGIKALNEERHIAGAVESALAAVALTGGEVVLADCGSTDRTVEIAKSYPIRIVQLTAPARRSCGTGAQLAFQHATGDFFYLLDGDMVLDPAFLPAALTFLDTNPDVAGVGGRVEEINTENEEFRIRATTLMSGSEWRAGTVDRLDCGGLYRTHAIRQVGYFADLNLHAFEEFDLAVRLRTQGWKLARIDQPAVQHFGHRIGGYQLLWRRLCSGYAGGVGQVLRAALGQQHFLLVIRQLSHVRNAVAVVLWWGLLLACLVVPPAFAWKLGLTAAMILGPVLLLAWRRGETRLGIYSLAAWNVSALGLILGLLRRRIAPHSPLPSIEIAVVVSDRTANADVHEAPGADRGSCRVAPICPVLRRAG